MRKQTVLRTLGLFMLMIFGWINIMAVALAQEGSAGSLGQNKALEASFSVSSVSTNRPYMNEQFLNDGDRQGATSISGQQFSINGEVFTADQYARNRWNANPSLGAGDMKWQWATLQFTTIKRVNRIDVYQYNDQPYRVNKMIIEKSEDGQVFQQVESFNFQPSGKLECHLSETLDTKYIRVKVGTDGTNGGFNIAEIEAYLQEVNQTITLEEVMVTTNSATLTWNDLTDISGYKVYQNGILVTENMITQNTYKVDNLAPGQQYLFEVEAIKVETEENLRSNALFVTTSGLLQDLHVKRLSYNAIEIAWGVVEGVDGYNVYRNDILVTQEPITTTHCVIDQLNEDTTYDFEVKIVSNHSEQDVNAEIVARTNKEIGSTLDSAVGKNVRLPFNNMTLDMEYAGVALQDPHYYYWCISPIEKDGVTHLFTVRWPVSVGMGGWKTSGELVHFVSDDPEGPFTQQGSPILTNEMLHQDQVSIHNTRIIEVDGGYSLVYIVQVPGNRQEIGMLRSNSLDGPWEMVGDNGIVLTHQENTWTYNGFRGVTNPELLKIGDKYYIYFKAVQNGVSKYGYAVSDHLEGPYSISPNPITNNTSSIEDADAFEWNGKYYLLTTDNHGSVSGVLGYGILWESTDGENFVRKQVGFGLLSDYMTIPSGATTPYGSTRKFERPALLFRDGEPAYFYGGNGTNIKGEGGTCSYVMRIVKKQEDLPPIFNISPDLEQMEEDQLRLKLWYKEPASDWMQEALPIGNGNMGAMIFGKVDEEEIQLNEITMWEGGPGSPKWESNPYFTSSTSKYLNIERYRDEWFGNRNTAKLRQYSNALICNQTAFGAYQNYGSMKLDLTLPFMNEGTKEVTNYRRELDLNTGTQKVRYTIDDVDYQRDYFASHADDVIVVRLRSSKPNRLAFTLSNDIDDSPSKQISGKSKTYTQSVIEDTLTTEGKLLGSQVKFASQMKIIAGDATITPDNINKKLKVTQGEDVTILISIKTDYKNENNLFTDIDNPPDYKDGSDPLVDKVIPAIQAVTDKSYEVLRDNHIADYTNIMNRSTINFGGSRVSTKATNELLLESSQNQSRNPYIDELIFHYGKYLLLSTSRDSQLPANLQGLWNNSNKPPWYSDYHFNVNIQMIYWPSYVTNMKETEEPLIDFIKSIEAPGHLTAQKIHNADGFVIHNKSNAFGFTAPGGAFGYGWAPGSASWILQNLWEHYEFTGDSVKLQEDIYPLMKSNCRFWLDCLVVDPETGDMVTVPSGSPEHGPRSAGTTYDQELIWQLFTDTLKAAEILSDEDHIFLSQLEAYLLKLKPLQIGDSGQIKEWREEGVYGKDINGDTLSGADKTHRHLSHLLGLYPGDHILKDSPYMDAAIKSLTLRGDAATGWSRAHKLNLWARTGNSQKSYDLLTGFINRCTGTSGQNGGVYDNLLCAHPPFQLDGNSGTTAGIAEMLLQSHGGYMEPLPALPSQWNEGSFSGLLARGQFEVGAQWANQKLKTLSIHSQKGKECVIVYAGIDSVTLTDSSGLVLSFNVLEEGNKISFPTIEGETYTLTMPVNENLYINIHEPSLLKSSGWKNSGLTDSTGEGNTCYYTSARDEYIQYPLNNLPQGRYKAYFWNIARDQNPMRLSADIKAGSTVIDNVSLDSVASDQWTLIGTYDFSSESLQYIKLKVVQGGKYSRVGNIKLEKVN